MVIDAFEFARTAGTAAGELPLTAMGRVDTPDRHGVLRWRAEGSRDRDGKTFLRIEIEGEIVLVCQRCLEPVAQPIAIAALLQLAANEREADRAPMDQDDLDVIVGSKEFDLAGLIEDEVLLALPSVPMHRNCSMPAVGQADESDVADAGAGPRQFAVLGALKKSRAEK